MLIAPKSSSLSPAAFAVVGLYVPGSIIKSIDPVLFLPDGEFKFVFVGIVSSSQLIINWLSSNVLIVAVPLTLIPPVSPGNVTLCNWSCDSPARYSPGSASTKVVQRTLPAIPLSINCATLFITTKS